jgi:transposase
VNQAVPLQGGANGTLLAALTPGGRGAALPVSGAVHGAVFAAYLEQVLGPTLGPGEVVVLDKLPAHQVEGLARLLEAHGAHLLYLPPYAPDFHPLDLAFSKRKTRLRQGQARSRQALEEAIQAATEWSSPQDAQNWLAHCGYHLH